MFGSVGMTEEEEVGRGRATSSFTALSLIWRAASAKCIIIKNTKYCKM